MNHLTCRKYFNPAVASTVLSGAQVIIRINWFWKKSKVASLRTFRSQHGLNWQFWFTKLSDILLVTILPLMYR